ncbi:hypothetical protein DBY21_10080 [Candidatus Gastranaerophilales bacterium]|nr:MAG: hypothetical protein DBY21_10080 [Candidatus Gastranaerophilales bacterium]
MPLSINSVNNNVISFRANETKKPKQKSPETSQKSGLSDGEKILAGLGAVAAITLAGIAIVNKIKKGGSVSSTNPTEIPNPIKKLEDEIKSLANSIKEKYFNDKKTLGENAYDELNYFQREQLGKKTITSTKDYEKIISLYSDFKDFDGLKLDEAKNTLRELSTSVKNKLKTLNQDNDWTSLVKMRNSIRRQQTKNPMSFSQDDYARSYLINEILWSKANGKASPLLTALKIDVNDAVNLVKTPKTAEAFEILRQDFMRANPLKYRDLQIKNSSISHLFSEGEKIRNLQSKVHRKLETIETLNENKENFRNNLKVLATQYKESDDVKKLKELTNKLAELKNTSS